MTQAVISKAVDDEGGREGVVEVEEQLEHSISLSPDYFCWSWGISAMSEIVDRGPRADLAQSFAQLVRTRSSR